jgi:hypothetical protein
MKVSTFDFSFTFKGKKLHATCQKMKIHKYPQIRVAIESEKGKADVYIFYEINEPKSKFFWFNLIGIKQDIATTIAKKLERKLYA